MRYTFETGDRETITIRDEVESVIDRLADEGSVLEQLGNVSWRPIESDYRSPWMDKAPPSEIKAPQVTKTTTEDNSHSGVGRLYRWFDGEYIIVDKFRTLAYSYWAISDYFAANYGTVPHLSHGSWHLFTDERQIPGSHELLGRGPDSDQQAKLFAVLRGERYDLSLAEAATLLEVDEFYHLLATKLPVAVTDTTIDQQVIGWLESDDPDTRAQAIRWISAVALDTPPTGKWREISDNPTAVPSIAGVDTFERFVKTLPSVDATTQQLVACRLWEPWVLSADEPLKQEYVSVLAGLIDAELPAVRVGALHGASRVLGELIATTDDDNSGSDSLNSLTPAVESFFNAYVAALYDEHPIVRARAADMMVSLLAGSPDRNPVFIRTLLDTVTFDTRWTVVRGIERLTEDNTAIATRLSDDIVEFLFEEISDGSPAAVEALTSHGYDEQGPVWKGARKALATEAEENPEAVVEQVDAPLEAVNEGTATAADLVLLNALVPVAPGKIASASGSLAELLNGPNEVRVETAWTLTSLRAERPSAVPVDRGTLVDIIAEVRDENDRFVPERLERLATVAPERATDVLTTIASDVSSSLSAEVSSPSFAKAVQIVGRVDPLVVASAADEICDVLPKLRSFDQEAFVGLARAAVARPESFTDNVDSLVKELQRDDNLTREALATALVAVGKHDSTALPSSIRPLLSQADDVYDPEELDSLEESQGITFSREDGPLDVINNDLHDRN